MTRRRRRAKGVKFSLFVFQDIITCVMGIMLLLTLMLCLQIVVNPGLDDVKNDRRALAELRQLAESLRANVDELQSAVSRNRELLDSGVLMNQDILAEQQQQTKNDNALLAQSIKDVAARTKRSSQTGKSLRDAASKDPAISQTKAAVSKAADATKILRKLQAGRLVPYQRPKGSKTCWLIEVSSPSQIKVGRIGRKEKPISINTYGDCLTWIKNQSSADFLIVVKPKAWDVKSEWEQPLQQAGITYAFDVIGQDKAALDDIMGAGY
jgi:hypothetical protein